jgi:hypothetical protein
MRQKLTDAEHEDAAGLSAVRRELEAWVWRRLEHEGFDLALIKTALEEGDTRVLAAVRTCLPMDVAFALQYGLEASRPMRQAIYDARHRLAEEDEIVDELHL